ncbi:hypothetical protein M3Y99_00523600 [Aphelenchoides fujianensis]|nr:hypothetical protein M3Y99_00523600 [Aphelenchoides fujianensis]
MPALMRSLLFGLLLTAVVGRRQAGRSGGGDDHRGARERARERDNEGEEALESLNEMRVAKELSCGEIEECVPETAAQRIHAFARSYINGDREDTRFARPSFQGLREHPREVHVGGEGPPHVRDELREALREGSRLRRARGGRPPVRVPGEEVLR